MPAPPKPDYVPPHSGDFQRKRGQPVHIFTDRELQEDAFKPNSLPRVWKATDSMLLQEPWAHPITFSTFDSRFYGLAFKNEPCLYRANNGKTFPMLGREANYYYQGLLFAAFGQSKETMAHFMHAWKASYFVQNPVLGAKASVDIASQNDFFMANLGYEDYPWYVSRGSFPDADRIGATIHRPRTLNMIWSEAFSLGS